MRGILTAAMVVAAMFANVAHAEWRVATSPHFVVYSEDTEPALRDTVTKLEKFDRILRVFSGTTKPPAPLKLVVYQMKDMNAVKAVLPYETYGIGGFYASSPRGPYLVATRQGMDGPNTMRTRVSMARAWGPEVLQHEYVHHFMYQYFPGTYPTWYSEGFAELWGSLAFRGDAIELGHAPVGRVETLDSNWVPIKRILTARSYADMGQDMLTLYSEGWLLAHLAQQDPVVGKQMVAYLNGIVRGEDYAKAARDAFGADLDGLDAKLRAHLRDLKAMRYPLKPIDTGTIAIRTLDAYETALLRIDIRLRATVAKDDVSAMARSTRALVGTRTDEHGLSLLIETERLAGDEAAAMADAKRLLAAHPDSGMAMYYKADLEIEALERAKSTDQAAWDKARDALVAASRAAPGTPQILEAYYDSYAAQGQLPPASAQNALMRAHTLLPKSVDLRYKVAADFERRDMIPEAIAVIAPEAFEMAQTDEGKAEKERRERERMEAKIAGYAARETPREMLLRLQKKRAAATPKAP